MNLRADQLDQPPLPTHSRWEYRDIEHAQHSLCVDEIYPGPWIARVLYTWGTASRHVAACELPFQRDDCHSKSFGGGSVAVQRSPDKRSPPRDVPRSRIPFEWLNRPLLLDSALEMPPLPRILLSKFLSPFSWVCLRIRG